MSPPDDAPDLGDTVIYFDEETGLPLAALVSRIGLEGQPPDTVHLHAMFWPAEGNRSVVSVVPVMAVPHSSARTPDTWCWPWEVPGSRAARAREDSAPRRLSPEMLRAVFPSLDRTVATMAGTPPTVDALFAGLAKGSHDLSTIRRLFGCPLLAPVEDRRHVYWLRHGDTLGYGPTPAAARYAIIDDGDRTELRPRMPDYDALCAAPPKGWDHHHADDEWHANGCTMISYDPQTRTGTQLVVLDDARRVTIGVAT